MCFDSILDRKLWYTNARGFQDRVWILRSEGWIQGSGRVWTAQRRKEPVHPRDAIHHAEVFLFGAATPPPPPSILGTRSRIASASRPSGRSPLHPISCSSAPCVERPRKGHDDARSITLKRLDQSPACISHGPGNSHHSKCPVAEAPAAG